MFKRLKVLVCAPVVMTALLVAAVGVQPASFFWWYQPEPPKESQKVS